MNIEVWTLTVVTSDTSFGPHVSLHATERDALLSFRERFDPHGEGPFVPEKPDLFEVYVKAVAEFFDLQHVEVDKHYVDVGAQFVVAHIDTRHFEFEGVGQDEHEARLALQAAWKRHCDQAINAGQYIDRDYLTPEDIADSTVYAYTIGASYRDHEEIKP